MLIAVIVSVSAPNVIQIYLLSRISCIVMLSVVMLIAIITSVVAPNVSHISLLSRISCIVMLSAVMLSVVRPNISNVFYLWQLLK